MLQQLYARLSELLGLHDHLLLLNVIVGKIATNLKCYTEVSFSLLFLFSLLQILFCVNPASGICANFRVKRSLITP